MPPEIPERTAEGFTALDDCETGAPACDRGSRPAPAPEIPPMDERGRRRGLRQEGGAAARGGRGAGFAQRRLARAGTGILLEGGRARAFGRAAGRLLRSQSSGIPPFVSVHVETVHASRGGKRPPQAPARARAVRRAPKGQPSRRGQETRHSADELEGFGDRRGRPPLFPAWANHAVKAVDRFFFGRHAGGGTACRPKTTATRERGVDAAPRRPTTRRANCFRRRPGSRDSRARNARTAKEAGARRYPSSRSVYGFQEEGVVADENSGTIPSASTKWRKRARCRSPTKTFAWPRRVRRRSTAFRRALVRHDLRRLEDGPAAARRRAARTRAAHAQTFMLEADSEKANGRTSSANVYRSARRARRLARPEGSGDGTATGGAAGSLSTGRSAGAPKRPPGTASPRSEGAAAGAERAGTTSGAPPPTWRPESRSSSFRRREWTHRGRWNARSASSTLSSIAPEDGRGRGQRRPGLLGRALSVSNVHHGCLLRAAGFPRSELALRTGA